MAEYVRNGQVESFFKRDCRGHPRDEGEASQLDPPYPLVLLTVRDLVCGVLKVPR